MNYQCSVNSSLKNASIFRKYKKNQNVRSPHEHFAIGYVHNDNLPRGTIALQYVIQNNCRKVWWCFLMFFCTFWRSRRRKIGDFTKTILWLYVNYIERVKNIEQISEIWCKSDKKISKEDMKFFISIIYIETFLEQSIWICKWVSWWCHCLTIFHVICSQKWWKSHISAIRK